MPHRRSPPCSCCSGCSRCRASPRRGRRPWRADLTALTFDLGSGLVRPACGSPSCSRMPALSPIGWSAPSATTVRSPPRWPLRIQRRCGWPAHPGGAGRRHVVGRPPRGRDRGRGVPAGGAATRLVLPDLRPTRVRRVRRVRLRRWADRPWRAVAGGAHPTGAGPAVGVVDGILGRTTARRSGGSGGGHRSEKSARKGHLGYLRCPFQVGGVQFPVASFPCVSAAVRGEIADSSRRSSTSVMSSWASRPAADAPSSTSSQVRGAAT